MHGKGRLEYKDHSMYEGDFKEGKFDGKGQMKHSDGRIYVGQWVNDLMHGVGTFTWPDGTTYIGTWHQGKKNHKCMKGILNVNLDNVSDMGEDIECLKNIDMSTDMSYDEDSS